MIRLREEHRVILRCYSGTKEEVIKEMMMLNLMKLVVYSARLDQLSR